MGRKRKINHIRTEVELREYITKRIGKRNLNCVKMLEAFDELTEGQKVDFYGYETVRGLYEDREETKGYPFRGVPRIIFDEGKLCLNTGYVQIEEDGHIYLTQPRSFAGLYRKGGLEPLERFNSGIDKGIEIYRRIFQR